LVDEYLKNEGVKIFEMTVHSYVMKNKIKVYFRLYEIHEVDKKKCNMPLSPNIS